MRQFRLFLTITGMFVVATVLAGCADAPPLKHVLLAPPQADQAPPQRSNWRVKPVRVPEYLDSYTIQRRSSAYVLSQVEDAKWAQRLPSAITALLQETIDAQLETDRAKPYSVLVTIATFAPQPSGNVLLAARWRVKNDDTGDIVASDAALIRKPLPAKTNDADAIGRTMSGAVRELATQIVAAGNGNSPRT